MATPAPPPSSDSTWNQPRGFDTGIQVLNSLTHTKVPLVLPEEGLVRWYICGPTVYDKSHLGHARNYVTFDIIRRILSNHFGLHVVEVMNVTDIDDKIINTANAQGISFKELSSKFEGEFFRDMRMLNVLPPDMITRVSEYVDEIIAYIQKIIDNGYAYESNGSVYFDTAAFTKKHTYRRMEPMTASEIESQEKRKEEKNPDKRSDGDFALWKVSKGADEAGWESPWSRGRPGWHIECSAMASDVLGDTIDIHTGGIDLRFPHHDNELAQAEAYFDQGNQWVNYFIHSGHLGIAGKKMSKSLKNFISIREALDIYTPSQIRFLFLVHKYNSPFEYSEKSMDSARDLEKQFNSFFHNIKAVLREFDDVSRPQKYRQCDRDLMTSLNKCRVACEAALRDDFNTPLVINELLALVKETNSYLNCANPPLAVTIRAVANLIHGYFDDFGCGGANSNLNAEGDGIGVDDASLGFAGDVGGQDQIRPVLDIFSKFRHDVRSKTIEKDVSGVLKLCDTVRDDDLPTIGVRLEDKANGSVWKLEDPKTLLMEREAKLKEQQKKEKLKQEAREKEAAKEAKMQVLPEELFKGRVDPKTNGEMFSAFDESGLPTHDAEGEPLSNSRLKKLKKERDAHVKQRKKYLDLKEKEKESGGSSSKQ